jgi:hypothetical protein
MEGSVDSLPLFLKRNIMDEKIILAEDNQTSSKVLLQKDSKKTIDQIQELLSKLKVNFNNDNEFYEILKVIHGRFSKMELNLIELEKLKNAGI